jgi:hypothetical protein
MPDTKTSYWSVLDGAGVGVVVLAAGAVAAGVGPPTRLTDSST